MCSSDLAGEVEFSGLIYQYYADNAAALLADQPIELSGGAGSAIIRKAPVGVLLGIMPWNFPAYQIARFAGPNLVAGNTCILKHAPQCPETALFVAQIFKDAGAPEGTYVNIFATNDQTILLNKYLDQQPYTLLILYNLLHLLYSNPYQYNND